MRPIAKRTLINKVQLALPALTLIVVACELLFSLKLPRRDAAFVGDFVFFNATHVLLTFVFLHIHPSYQRWVL
jgi:hypothetical protein